MAKYKVGDKVRVKSWDKLAEEYGLNRYGDINMVPPFYKDTMGEWCGKVVTIDTILVDGAGQTYWIEEDEHYWDWDDRMFEDVSDNTEAPSNNVNHPSHYNDGNIEVIDYIEDKKLGFHLGNAIKYISRAGKKDKAKTKEDIEKAIWYLQRYLEVE